MSHIRTHDAAHIINIIIIRWRLWRREMCCTGREIRSTQPVSCLFIFLCLLYYYYYCIVVQWVYYVSPSSSPVLSTFDGIKSRFSHYAGMYHAYIKWYYVCTSTGTESSARAHIVLYYTRVYIRNLRFSGLFIIIRTFVRNILLPVLYQISVIIYLLLSLYTGSTGRVANFYRPCHVFKHVFDMI